jgi:hypothetical protein
MTSIQVEYWKNMENKRHNYRMEALTGEAQAEVARHNVQQEQIGYAQARAAQAQAWASQQNAETNRKLYELQQIRTEFDRQIAQHQMYLLDAQEKKTYAERDLTQAKATYQQYENDVYKLYRYNDAYARLENTKADTALKYAQISKQGTSSWTDVSSTLKNLYEVGKGVAALFA